MIATFADKPTEDLFHGRPTRHARRFPPDIVSAALRKLDSINAARSLSDLKAPPGIVNEFPGKVFTNTLYVTMIITVPP